MENIGRKIEPVIFGFVLLYGWDLDLPPAIGGVMKSVSYLILIVLIVPRWKQCAYVVTRDIPLLLLLGIALLSIFWSAAPFFTADDSKALLRSTLFGVYMATRYTPKQQMQLLGWILGIAGVFSVVFALAIPSYGIANTNNEISWKGIFVHKQYLGRQMAIGFVIFILTIFAQKKYRIIYLIGMLFMVILILLSRSKTALILLLLSLFMLPLYKIVKQHYKLKVLIFLIGLLLIGGMAILILSNLEFLLVDTLGKDLNLNGRVPIWNLILEKGLERPWLGYGYAGFWTSPESLFVLNNSWAGTEDLTGTRFHAHNGFVDLFIQLGLLGLSVFVFHFLKVFGRVVYVLTSTQAIEYFWMIEFLTLMILFNMTETITILSTGTLWTLYVSIALSSAVQQNRLRRNQDLQANLNKS
jgi:O-antigen ligase